jgi:hypothetical protein
MGRTDVFACSASAAEIGKRETMQAPQGPCRVTCGGAGFERAIGKAREASADCAVECEQAPPAIAVLFRTIQVWPEDLPAVLWQAELTALLPVVTPDGEAPCPT